MGFTDKFNPLRQWMNWKEVYVTFDSLEILKKQPNGELESLGTLNGGRMTWPLFAQTLGGMMQYSAMETGFSKPLMTATDYTDLAEHLEDHAEHSFVVRSKNLKAGFESVDKLVKAQNQWQDAGTSFLKTMNPWLAPSFDKANEMSKAVREHTTEMLRPVFPEDEMDLGEVARNMAAWLNRASKLTTPAQALGGGRA